MNANSLQWDDLRTVLAIAEAGSLSGAARRLWVSHATVFRRLGDIEKRLGVRLFERRRSGYTPTAAGEDLAAVAARIADEVHGVERRLAGRDLRPSGTVRVTTTDTLLAGVLATILSAFREAYPEIRLEVAVSNDLFNLSKREADVAIRPSNAPAEHLIGRRVGTIAQAVYGHVDAFSDGDVDPLAHDWIGPDERFAWQALDAWMGKQGHDERCSFRADTLMGVFAAVRAGIGLAALPCYLADPVPELRRVGEPVPELATDLWLLTHPDLRRTARVRAFIDYVALALQREQARLAGSVERA